MASSLRSTSRSGGPLTSQTGTPGPCGTGVFCALSEAFSPECRDRWRVRRRGTATPPPIRRLAHDRTLPPADALGRIRRSDASARPAWPPRTPGGPLGNRPRVLRRAGQPFNPDAPIRLANGRTDLRTQLDVRNRADRATFICHKRRCGKAYPARWEKLDAAFRRAIAEGRDRVCLPSDLRNGWPAGGPTRRRS